MKKIITRTVLGAMLVSAAFAGTTLAQNADGQKRGGKREHRSEQFQKLTVEQRVDKRLEQMKKNLALTEAQAAQIRAILIEDGNRMKLAHEARKAARDAQKEAGKLTKEQRQAARAEMKAQKDATKAKIQAVLTAEQKAKAETLMEQRKDKMKKHMKGRRDGGLQRATPEQQKDLKQNSKQGK